MTQKTESRQYNAVLATTGAIRGAFRKKNNHKLGLESFRKRRWYRKQHC